MPLVPAKCPECGGNIVVDSEKDAWICDFCKTPFIVDKAIQNFNTTYNIVNNNEIKADVVNIYESKKSDFVIEAGVLKDYIGESTNVVIPDNVDEIDPRAFYRKNIKVVVIPGSVKCVTGFLDCKKLEEVIIKEGAEIIGSEAFKDCESLNTVHIPDSINKIVDCYPYGSLGPFGNCNSLKRIVMAIGGEEISGSVIEVLNQLKYKNISKMNLDEKENLLLLGFPEICKERIEEKAKELATADIPIKEGGFFDDISQDSILKSIGVSKKTLNLNYTPFSHYANLKILYNYVISDRNPVKVIYNLVFYDLNSNSIIQNTKVLGIYGHYIFIDREGSDTSDGYTSNHYLHVGYFNESITTQQQLYELLSKKRKIDADYCRKEKICPNCRRPLNFFGRCKNSNCVRENFYLNGKGFDLET